MTIPNMIFTYLLVVGGALSIVAIYSDFRRQRFGPAPSEDRIFRCLRCGYVYTDDQDVDRSRCAQCGQMNEPIEF
jgi:hypothetical protein